MAEPIQEAHDIVVPFHQSLQIPRGNTAGKKTEVFEAIVWILFPRRNLGTGHLEKVFP